MAAVFVPPSPQTSLNMSTRRPLANVPNATNSPHRAGLVPAKRARSGQIEIPFGQPPPKKVVMDAVEQDRSRLIVHQGTESKLFARRSNNANPSAFEKKLVAAREKERMPQQKGSRTEKPSADTMDTIRQWQRHYRKAFPQFVFYFDSIPEDVRRKFSRQVVALGAVSLSISISSCFADFASRQSTCSFKHWRLVLIPFTKYQNLPLVRGEILLSSRYPCRYFTSHSPGSYCYHESDRGTCHRGRRSQWRQHADREPVSTGEECRLPLACLAKDRSSP